jgi:hypothetical protein
VGIAWLVFGVPHLVFHLDHLDGFGAVDRIGNAVALGATIALATVLVVGSHGGDDAVTAPVPGRADGGGS